MSSPPRKSKAGLVVVVVVLVLAVAGGAAYFLTQSDEGDGPVELVEQATDAFYKGDCEAFAGLITADSVEENGGKEEMVNSCKQGYEDLGEGDKLDSIKLVSEEGDKAVVEINETIDGEQESQEITVIKEDGEWRLSLTE